MKNVEVGRQLQRLKALINKALAETPDLELRSHWARYFCVVTSGVLENAIFELFSEYVTRTASPSVAGYANDQLATIQNPKAAKFILVTRSFNSAWGIALEQFMDVDGRKDAIDSIMANRHLVAHGNHTGITIVQVQRYLAKAEEVLEFIESKTNP